MQGHAHGANNKNFSGMLKAYQMEIFCRNGMWQSVSQ